MGHKTVIWAGVLAIYAVLVAVIAAANADPGAAVGITLGVTAAVLAYWAPTLIGWRRHVQNQGSVFVVNLFLGWTLIGWVVALAMAVRSPAPVTPVSG